MEIIPIISEESSVSVTANVVILYVSIIANASVSKVFFTTALYEGVITCLAVICTRHLRHRSALRPAGL